jgi:sulfatase maturation enzyme AslB (radical SAM superfamily)
MYKFLEIIAEKINNGIKVYFCPASFETVIIAKMLKDKYNVRPTGFCDNDNRKQDMNLRSLPGLRIYSFDTAAADATSEFLVVSPFHSAAITGDLIYERNIDSSRIIGFQQIERRKTCARYALNWVVEDKTFICCCIEEYKPTFDNQKLDVAKGIEYLDRTRKDLIDEVMDIPEGCKNCFQYKDAYIYKSRKLNSFDFSFKGWCNYKCTYCSAHHPTLKDDNKNYALEEYLTELENRGISNDIFSVLFAVGEPTLNEKRFALYEHCGQRGYFLDVFSNCSVFDKDLFELAHRAPVIIRSSFDAGTPETYKKIKGIDSWDRMLANVKHYSEAKYLALNPKYLFDPGINDNETDITNFVKICAELNVDFVTPAFSFLDSKYFDSDNAKKMFKLLVELLARNGIFTANVDTMYSQDYHKVYSESF